MASTKWNLKFFLPPIMERQGNVHLDNIVTENKASAQTWGGSGVSTTKTVTDTRVKSDSIIFVMPTGSVAQIGHWRITTRTTDTSFVITSTDAEQAGLTFEYILF